MPNDEDEQTRLQIMHEVYLRAFDYKLTNVPSINPKRYWISEQERASGRW
jgi:hypothetical protein